MLRIFLLIALRKLAKEKAYVLINIFSLALGVSTLLIPATALYSICVSISAI